jgi:RHS repeat-associated protein
VSEFYNYPFGFPRHEHHAGDPFDPHYQFTGKEQDAESGLHYFEARYDDSVVGRFLTSDPLYSENAGDCEDGLVEPQRWNVYAYALNNPVVMIDPTGQAAKHTITLYAQGTKMYYKVESTVYVHFDKTTGLYKWLHPGGKWDPNRARQVEELLKSEFDKRVNETAMGTGHKWGTFEVKAKFVLTDKPTLTKEQQKDATMLLFRQRKSGEKDWGLCGPGEGFQCWFGEDPGGGPKNANIYVDAAGNLKHTGVGHFHEALHGMGFRHAVTKDQAGKLTPHGVPEIMGYGGKKMSRAYQQEFVEKVLKKFGRKTQEIKASEIWKTGDVEIQRLRGPSYLSR